MKIQHKIRQHLLEQLPTSLLVLSAVLFLMTGYQLSIWWKAHQLNLAYDNKSILKQPLKNDEYLKAYSIGYLLASKNKPIEAQKAFNVAEVTLDPELRARAKYAIANVHFESAIASSDIEHGGSHRRAVERILLAREAYKGALRIKPDMYNARYNLELIDRLSPEKRTEGYENSPDGTIGLQPYQQNGTALMKDNTRRGLP
jgi:mxaK protein